VLVLGIRHSVFKVVQLRDLTLGRGGALHAEDHPNGVGGALGRADVVLMHQLVPLVEKHPRVTVSEVLVRHGVVVLVLHIISVRSRLRHMDAVGDWPVPRVGILVQRDVTIAGPLGIHEVHAFTLPTGHVILVIRTRGQHLQVSVEVRWHSAVLQDHPVGWLCTPSPGNRGWPPARP